MFNPKEVAEHVSIKTYIVGYVLSIILSLGAYLIVQDHWSSYPFHFIVLCAVLQTLVQLIAFLHLGKEARPRSNLLVFLFMLLVLTIIVIGSLLIMHSLNDRMIMTMP